MVVISSAANPQADADGGVQLPADVVVPIYRVPSERWLVVTDFQTPSAQLLRVVAGAASVVVDTDLNHFNPRTGVAFPPGSTVALRSIDSTLGVKSYYHFGGYLALANSPSACRSLPPPDDMVVLNSREVAGSVLGYLPVPAHATIPIYSVPRDKWLVLTDPDVQGSGIQLVQINATAIIPMARYGTYTIGHPPTVGLAFPPGSQVGIHNPLSQQQDFCKYLITGYLRAN